MLVGRVGGWPRDPPKPPPPWGLSETRLAKQTSGAVGQHHLETEVPEPLTQWRGSGAHLARSPGVQCGVVHVHHRSTLGNPWLFFPQLAGGVILGVALWLRHDPQTTNLLYLELGDRPAPNTFYIGECTWGRPRTPPGSGLGDQPGWPIKVSDYEPWEATDRQSGRASRRRQGLS